MKVITKPTRQSKPGSPALTSRAGTTPPVSYESRGGWYAVIEAANLRAECSKLDGEGIWTVDAMFNAESGYPLFVNGYGQRAVVTQTLDAKFGEALDALIGEMVSATTEGAV